MLYPTELQAHTEFADARLELFRPQIRLTSAGHENFCTAKLVRQACTKAHRNISCGILNYTAQRLYRFGQWFLASAVVMIADALPLS
jgi:hypothetical protein